MTRVNQLTDEAAVPEFEEVNALYSEFYAIEPGTAFTHSFWFKRFAESTDGNGDLVALRAGLYNPGHMEEITISQDGDGILGFPGVNAAVDDTKWHHMGIIIRHNEGSYGVVEGCPVDIVSYSYIDFEIYLDNELIGSGTRHLATPLVQSVEPDFTQDPPVDPCENGATTPFDPDDPLWDPQATHNERLDTELFNFARIPGFRQFDGYVDDWIIVAEDNRQLITDMYERGDAFASAYTSDKLIIKAVDPDTFSAADRVIDKEFAEQLTAADVTLEVERVPVAFDVVIVSTGGHGIGSNLEVNKVRPQPTDEQTVTGFDDNFQELVSTGTIRVLNGDKVDFRAPEIIYLDRYGNELDRTAADVENQAFSRVILKEHSVDTDAATESVTNGTGDTFFSKTVTSNIRVVWKWEQQYAVIVENAHEDYNELNEHSGGPTVQYGAVVSNGVGKHWVPAGELTEAVIAGTVAQGNTGQERFRIKEMILENADSANGFCANFASDQNDYLSGATGVDLQRDSFTIEFWAKVNDLSLGTTQTLFCWGDSDVSGERMRIQHSALGFEILNGHSARKVLADDALDTRWHHWAVTLAPSGDDLELRVYCDGELVESHIDESPTYSGNDILTLGATLTDGSASDFLGGSIDNVARSIIFGEARGATDDFDSGLDASAAVADNVYLLKDRKLSADFRPPNDDGITRWRLVVEGSPARSATRLSWEVPGNAARAATDLLYLQQLDGEQPVGPAIDMRSQTILDLSDAAVFEIALGPNTEVGLPIAEGWTLLGTPVMTAQTAGEIPGTAGLDILGFTGNYLHIGADDALNAERGFWVYSAVDSQLSMSGVVAYGLTELAPGWSLFSPVADSALPTDPRITVIWAWDSRTQLYRAPDGLTAGQAYWIYVDGSNSLELTTGL